MAPLFEIAGANLGYGDAPILRDVSLRVEPGERIAVVGASGAGKSTLLRVLHERRRAATAFVPQDCALVDGLSVYHNVYVGRLDRHATLYNVVNLIRPWRRDVEAVRAVLGQVDLPDRLHTPVTELSGGQRQRTAVARALFQGGDVLLGDEPVSALDAVQARIVLGALRATFGTLVLAMHDVGLALEFCDRIVGLKRGRVEIDHAAAGLSAAALEPLYR